MIQNTQNNQWELNQELPSGAGVARCGEQVFQIAKKINIDAAIWSILKIFMTEERFGFSHEDASDW